MNNNPQVLSATTMIGDRVISATGEELGDLKELMIDLDNRLLWLFTLLDG